MIAKVFCVYLHSGKIPYFTSPPDEHSLPSHISSEIVSSFSKGLKMNSVTHHDGLILEGRVLATFNDKILGQGFFLDKYHLDCQFMK